MAAAAHQQGDAAVRVRLAERLDFLRQGFGFRVDLGVRVAFGEEPHPSPKRRCAGEGSRFRLVLTDGVLVRPALDAQLRRLVRT